MKLIAVGRMKDKSEQALVARYLKRLRPKLDIVELADGRGSPDEIKRREAQAILAACPDQLFWWRLMKPDVLLTAWRFLTRWQTGPHWAGRSALLLAARRGWTPQSFNALMPN